MAHFKIAGMVIGSAGRRPKTRLYPFEVRAPFAATRGKIVMDIKGCNFCTLCERRCPTGAIKVLKEEKTWQIDRFRCIVCGACVASCMRKCPTMGNMYTAPATEKQVEVFHQEAAPAAASGQPKA